MTFLKKNHARLAAYSRMSQVLGARADYVQGGGGNTSVKLEDGHMAIKASGYCLKDVTPEAAYAVLQYEPIRDFYANHALAQFEDAEKSGAAVTKENTCAVEGLASLRPSVEAGFHSVLGTFVAHTHSVYANLLTCCADCTALAEQAFTGADYTWGAVDYADPGAKLTFYIRDELARCTKRDGKAPSVILMKNHGLIVQGDTAEDVLRIHADANRRFAALFGLSEDAFQAPQLRQEGNHYACTLDMGVVTPQALLTKPLYPDQLVFLGDTLQLTGENVAEDHFAIRPDGTLELHMPEKKAKTVSETVAAVVFICNAIYARGLTPVTLDDAARNFIDNWESEKYRKSLTSK